MPLQCRKLTEAEEEFSSELKHVLFGMMAKTWKTLWCWVHTSVTVIKATELSTHTLSEWHRGMASVFYPNLKLWKQDNWRETTLFLRPACLSPWKHHAMQMRISCSTLTTAPAFHSFALTRQQPWPSLRWMIDSDDDYPTREIINTGW